MSVEKSDIVIYQSENGTASLGSSRSGNRLADSRPDGRTVWQGTFGTDLHFEGLDGVFGNSGATKIIHLLEEIELKAAA